MEWNEFLTKLRMPEEAVHQLNAVEMSEEEYVRAKYLYQQERPIFSMNILQEADFPIRFLYCFSRMAWELYTSGEWEKRCQIFREVSLCEEQIFWDTFYDLTLWCEDYVKKHGTYGFVQYDWIWRHLDGSLFRLGRLQFEVLENLIHIHIPAGVPLEIQEVKQSLEMAKKVWGTKKPYVCHSWLLDPALQQILKKESNILQFQKLFRISSVDHETREAEERIFGEVKEALEEYPAHTSLQKQAREYLMEGKLLGNGYGMLKMNQLNTR